VKVLGRFQASEGGKDWFPGTVEKVNSNGSFAILYDDGDREDEVERPFVRVITGHRRGSGDEYEHPRDEDGRAQEQLLLRIPPTPRQTNRQTEEAQPSLLIRLPSESAVADAEESIHDIAAAVAANRDGVEEDDDDDDEEGRGSGGGGDGGGEVKKELEDLTGLKISVRVAPSRGEAARRLKEELAEQREEERRSLEEDEEWEEERTEVRGREQRRRRQEMSFEELAESAEDDDSDEDYGSRRKTKTKKKRKTPQHKTGGGPRQSGRVKASASKKKAAAAEERAMSRSSRRTRGKAKPRGGAKKVSYSGAQEDCSDGVEEEWGHDGDTDDGDGVEAEEYESSAASSSAVGSSDEEDDGDSEDDSDDDYGGGRSKKRLGKRKKKQKNKRQQGRANRASARTQRGGSSRPKKRKRISDSDGDSEENEWEGSDEGSGGRASRGRRGAAAAAGGSGGSGGGGGERSTPMLSSKAALARAANVAMNRVRDKAIELAMVEVSSMPMPSAGEDDEEDDEAAVKVVCESAIDAMSRIDMAQGGVFAAPVPADTPDYFEMVMQPMDLGTIRKKMQQQQYTLPGTMQREGKMGCLKLFIVGLLPSYLHRIRVAGLAD
jgi:hypothetical protein